MNYDEFEIGFWHPFGPFGKRTIQQIVEWKRDEAETNGWTLWTFQHRRERTFDVWRERLPSAPRRVLVFCSNSPRAKDPGARVDCSYYRFAGSAEWRPVPEGIRVTCPCVGKKLASAFVVQRVIFPAERFERPVNWLSVTKNVVCEGPVPTRGEYLIRPGGTCRMRRVWAVLELKFPYLAEVIVSEGLIPNPLAHDVATSEPPYPDTTW